MATIPENCASWKREDQVFFVFRFSPFCPCKNNKEHVKLTGALLVDVDTIKNLLEKSLVQHFDMFPLFRQVHHVRLSNFGKRVHYNLQYKCCAGNTADQ